MTEYICGNCVGEPYLKKLIGDRRVLYPVCSYCGKTISSIELSALATRIEGAIEVFFEPTNASDDVPSDYDPKGEPLVEIIQRYAEVSGEVAEDLAELLIETWFDRDSMIHQYGEDPYFVERFPEIAMWSNAWGKMEHSLKHEARLVNPSVVTVLNDLLGPLLHDRTYDGKEVVVEIGPGCPVDSLYRARVFQTHTSMEHALSHPERHLGPPPEGEGAAGRMNAKGVSVFYGATTSAIARSEVRPPVGSFVVVAKFKVLKPLRVLDMTQLGSIAVRSESIFDQRTAEEARRCHFLEALSRRLVMPVMPELEERDYLITQAIADFLATNDQLKLDGIMFKSAQEPGGKGSDEARNVTLFNKASRVRRAGIEFSGDVLVNLVEADDDGARFEPMIWSEPKRASKGRRAWEHEEPETLDLDKDSIEIHEIRSVSYKTIEHRVQHTQRKEMSSRRLRREAKFE